MVPWKSFLGFVFKIFEKRKKIFLTISTSKGPPFGKKIENIKKIFFFGKNHTFSLWICIVHVLSFLLMYITLMYQKFSILTYFCMKIFIFRHGLLTAGLAKTTAHRVLFLVSMDSQRSKKFDGSHFWALECLLTASEWLESIRAIMAFPPSNVIPEPAQNRVNWLSHVIKT